MSSPKKSKIIEIVESVKGYEESINAIKELVDKSVSKKETIYVLAQHLHADTYDILQEVAGKTPIRLMLSKQYKKQKLELIRKNKEVHFADLQELIDKGVEIKMLKKKDIDYSDLPSYLPELHTETWSSLSGLVFLYPHE